jgi:hypothetical protein
MALRSAGLQARSWSDLSRVAVSGSLSANEHLEASMQWFSHTRPVRLGAAS